MEFLEKREIIGRICDDSHIDDDRRLLAQHCPDNELLRRPKDGPGGDTLSYDILYALLDFVTEEEIISCRKKDDSSATLVTAGAVPGPDDTAVQTSPVSDDETPAEKTQSKPKAKTVKKKTRSTRASAGGNSTNRKSSGRS